jgi:hypothetical protein
MENKDDGANPTENVKETDKILYTWLMTYNHERVVG